MVFKVTWETRAVTKFKIPFSSFGLTQLVLIILKTSNFHCQPKRRHKVVASKQVQIPSYKGNGRQRAGGFGALARVFGRTAIAFLRKYVVPAESRVVWDLSGFAAPKFVEVVSGKKFFRQLQSLLWVNLRKQLVSGSRRRKGAIGARELRGRKCYQKLCTEKSFKRFLTKVCRKNKGVGSEETFLQSFLKNLVKDFSVPNFRGFFRKPKSGNPHCWQRLVVPRPSFLFYYLARWILHRV